MKKLKVILKVLLFAALVAPWSSCSKSDDNVSDEGKDKDPYMEVCEHVVDVANEVAVFYDKSETIADMAEYIDEIKEMENVEEVYTSTTTMFIKIKDYGVITFSKFPKEIEDVNDIRPQMSEFVNTLKSTRRSSIHSQIESESAIVINQQSKDEKMIDRRLVASTAITLLNNCNVSATPEDAPNVSFFGDDIFEYDIVLLITHGIYDIKTGLHWLLTGEQLSNDNTEYVKAEDIYVYKGMPRDQVSIGCVDEVRNGKTVTVWFATVSEKFIAASSKSFKNYGKAIVFNGACQSMQGPSTEHIDSINYSMARVFEDKGACAYFGYDESNYYGQEAGLIFIGHLLSGMSIENSYKAIHSSYQHEYHTKGKWFWKEETWVDLVPYYPHSKNYCITRPTVDVNEVLSNDSELEYHIKGNSQMVFRTISYDINTDSYFVNSYNMVFGSLVKYGIEISESNDFKNYTSLIYQPITECNYDGTLVSFSSIITPQELKPKTTYYVRSLFYDGKDTYYSDPCSFTTKSISISGDTNIPDIPGTDL